MAMDPRNGLPFAVAYFGDRHPGNGHSLLGEVRFLRMAVNTVLKDEQHIIESKGASTANHRAMHRILNFQMEAWDLEGMLPHTRWRRHCPFTR